MKGRGRELITTKPLAPHEADLDAHFFDQFVEPLVGSVYKPYHAVGYRNADLSANVLYAAYLYLPRAMSFSAIRCQVITLAAGASARMGVYNSSSLVPTTLVKDFGEVSVASTGVKEIADSLSLSKGFYFVAIVSDGTPTIRGVLVHGSPLGANPTDMYGYSYVGYTASHSYAALPANYPSETIGTGLPCPLMTISSLD